MLNVYFHQKLKTPKNSTWILLTITIIHMYIKGESCYGLLYKFSFQPFIICLILPTLAQFFLSYSV